MINTRTFLLLFAGTTFFLSAVNVGAFGDSSFRRQQSQADDGFKEFDAEFAEPEAVKPPPPQIIIRERIIIKEKLVPVPVPVPVEKIPIQKPVVKVPIPQSSASEKVVDIHGYRFTLGSCTLLSRNIECNLTVVRTQDDAVLSLYPSNYHSSYGPTSIFDNNGNQFIAASIVVGNSEHHNEVSHRLIKGITTRIKVYFNKVSSDTGSISVLEIRAHDGANKKKFNIQFRGVPLT